MKESKQDKLQKELSEFFEHLSKEYDCGLGVVALDISRDGSTVLGMVFGKKSLATEKIFRRLDESCKNTIRGAQLELKDELDDDLIVLPDTSDRAAVLKFAAKHDLFDKNGNLDRKKTDALFEKIIEQDIKCLIRSKHSKDN